MPLYEFRCAHCKEVSEFILPVGKHKRKCPNCSQNKLIKVISKTNYHDTYSSMHPRRGRGVDGYGRIDPGEGMQDFGKNL